MRIIQVSDYNEMSRKAANIISAEVILNPKAVLGFATGSTPIGIYSQLIDWYKKGDIDFSQVTTVNLDEYCGLDVKNKQSYRYFMDNNFFNHINIDKVNTHLPNGMANDYDEECLRYDAIIENLDGIDLQLLGIGYNGHIGFNEPNEAFNKTTHCVKLHPITIEANSRFFSSNDEIPKYAITLGMKSIMQARKILLVVGSSTKKEILNKALYGPITPKVPASILQLHPNLDVVTV